MAPTSSSSPSLRLPREGDIVKGRYKILRGKTVEYDVLNVQTGKVSSKHYSLSNKDRYAHSHLPKYRHYQVDGINIEYTRDGLNSAIVKLILLQEPQGKVVQGPRRTFKLEEKGKILEIRDALEGGDKDVYCTLINVSGVKVLDDIRSLHKDPPILRLPEEMMDMICSYLPDRDLYSLRLVSSVIPQKYLPIHKLFRISELGVEVDRDNDGYLYTERKKGDLPSGPRYFCREPHLDFTNESYQEFLRTTPVLRVYRGKGRKDEKLLSAVRNNCTNLKMICITFREVLEQNLISQLTSRNEGTLEELYVELYEEVITADSEIDLAFLSGCKKLRDVSLECGRIMNLESLLSFKDNLKNLSFKNLKEPLIKEQLIWISKNLLNLESLDVSVVHHCLGPKLGEVDDQTIVSILEGIDKSIIDFDLTISFHGCTDGRVERGRVSNFCSKASRLRKQVMRALKKDKGISSGWKSHQMTHTFGGYDYYSSLLHFHRMKEGEVDFENYEDQ